MTNIELLAAQLAESVLMDWDKEKQVELAKKIAVAFMRATDASSPEPIKEPCMAPPIAVMYGVQIQPYRAIDVGFKETSDSLTIEQ